MRCYNQTDEGIFNYFESEPELSQVSTIQTSQETVTSLAPITVEALNPSTENKLITIDMCTTIKSSCSEFLTAYLYDFTSSQETAILCFSF